MTQGSPQSRRGCCSALRAGWAMGWAGGGFTLIELLAVVTILSMLIAILIPALRTARQQAKRVKCQAQLRTIAQAWRAYLIANDDHFLQGANYQVNCGGRQGDGSILYRVPKPLNRFVGLPDVVPDKGAELFQCPADRGPHDLKSE